MIQHAAVTDVSGIGQLIAELTYPSDTAVLNGLFNESWVC